MQTVQQCDIVVPDLKHVSLASCELSENDRYRIKIKASGYHIAGKFTTKTGVYHYSYENMGSDWANDTLHLSFLASKVPSLFDGFNHVAVSFIDTAKNDTSRHELYKDELTNCFNIRQ